MSNMDTTDSAQQLEMQCSNCKTEYLYYNLPESTPLLCPRKHSLCRKCQIIFNKCDAAGCFRFTNTSTFGHQPLFSNQQTYRRPIGSGPFYSQPLNVPGLDIGSGFLGSMYYPPTPEHNVVYNTDTRRILYVDVERLNKLYEIMEKDRLEMYTKLKEYEKMQTVALKKTFATLNCSECGESEQVTKIQMCATCMEQKNVPIRRGEMSSFVICSSCAIQKHLNKGHGIIDYSKMLLVRQNESRHQKVEDRIDEVEKKKAELISSMNDLWSGVNKVYNTSPQMLEKYNVAKLTNGIFMDVMSQSESLMKTLERANIVVHNDEALIATILEEINNKLEKIALTGEGEKKASDEKGEEEDCDFEMI